MKKQLIILALSSMAISGFAEAPSEPPAPCKDKKDREQPQRPNRNPEEMRERHQAMTGKMLTELGVSKEDQLKFQELQKSHREKMMKNRQQTMKAHQKLEKLQEKGASEEELDAAIQQVADLKAAEMKLIVKSRMKSEAIIGKENHAKFMNVAREKYRQHKGQKGPQGQKGPERPQRKGKGQPEKPAAK